MKVQDVENPLMRLIRSLDKLVDELAKGPTDGDGAQTLRAGGLTARRVNPRPNKRKSRDIHERCPGTSHRSG